MLRENTELWTAAFLSRRRADATAELYWPVVGGQRLNQLLLPLLMAMTAEHCAYCDGHPLDVTGQPSIDHFRPKAHFPEQGFAWSNLFPSCERCQRQKADRWHEDLLKPDDLEYAFERYFRYDHRSGRLGPDPEASTQEQARAELTIRVLGLNSGGRPQSRVRESKRGSELPLHERPFRFVFRVLG